MKTKWAIHQTDKVREMELEKLEKEQLGTYNFSRPVLEFLHNKGARTLDDIIHLTDISMDLENNPFEMKDVQKATAVISEHIDKGSYIVVLGDYDTDGVCSTTIMVRALRYLGAEVDYYVNNRFIHGYGINEQVVIDMLKEKDKKPDLIVTVDNGIVGYEGIAYAMKEGIDVVVTDHHIANAKLPDARAVVNPHRLDDTSSFKDICGATVAYKTMLVLYYEREMAFDYLYDMRDLVALATVGDVMPLVNENRWYVVQGLELIGKGRRKQFEILRETIQGEKSWNLTADLFGFLLSPIMNAPGRLEGVPNKAIDFFLAEDEDEMKDLAKQLVDINQRRKTVTSQQVELAESIVDTDSANVIVAYHPDFHEGIIGLIAGQLKEKYYKPAVVFGNGPGGTIKGSARSVESYHIKEAFDRVSEHILGYGGHAGAAGLSLEADKFEDFKKALEIDAASLKAEDLKPVVKADAVLNPSEVTEDLVRELNLLQPFGQGFEPPLFGLTSLDVDRVFYMTDGKHAKIVGKNNLNILMFGGGEHVRSLGEFKRVKAIGSPSLNTYQGRTSVQFQVHRDCLVGR